MVNITVAPGGGIIANDVITYLPQCSTLEYEDVVLANAKHYDVTDSSYLTRLIPSAVPGILFGILCLLAFIFWSIWLCTQCHWRQHNEQRAGLEHAQFVTNKQAQSAEYVSQHPLRCRRNCPAFCYKALLVAFALLLAGISTWGMVESIDATNRTFTDLWDIARVVIAKVDNATGDLILLEQYLAELSGNVSVVSSKGPEVLNLFDKAVGFLTTTDLVSIFNASSSPILTSSVVLNTTERVTSAINVTNMTAVRGSVKSAVESILDLPSDIDGIQASIKSATTLLNDNFNKTITNIRQSYEKPTLTIQNTWRFIPIAVVFGTTILISLLSTVTFWGLRWYRSSTLALMLLWLDITLLMFLGVGLLRSVYVVTSDSCLYAEYLFISLTERKVAETQRTKVLNIFKYYYGLEAIPDQLVVNKLLGVATYKLHEAVSGPFLGIAGKILELAQTPEIKVLLEQAGLEGENCKGCISSLDNMTMLLPNISTAVWRLEEQALKASIDPLYHQIKEYLCCTLSRASSNTWIAWTCAGVIGFVLGTLCSARISHHTLNLRRYERQLATAAAAAAVDANWPAPVSPLGSKDRLALQEGSNGSTEKAATVRDEYHDSEVVAQH